MIRAKYDLLVTLATGATRRVDALLPSAAQAYLFHNVTVLGDVACHLATATLPEAKEAWAVLSDRPPSWQTFGLYGSRFGGIEPHFKYYKSAAFEVVRSRLRDAAALTGLFLLLDAATLIALVLGMMLVHCGQRSTLDGHPQRGLSFLQLGLRQLQRLCYQGKLLPPLKPFPAQSPPAAVASESKREQLDRRIQFSRITSFSS